MAQPQWNAVQANFGRGTGQALAAAQRGIQGFTKGMGDIQNRIAAEEKAKRDAEQQAFANQMAQDKMTQQMTIAKMPYEEKARLAGLQSDVITDTPKNLVAENIGTSIGREYDVLSAQPESPTKTAQLAAFDKKYQSHAVTDPMQRQDAIAAPEFTQAREGFDAVADVSDTVIDPKAYSSRIRDEALKSGLGIDTATKLQASALANSTNASKRTKDENKAMQKASEVVLKSNLKYLENLYKGPSGSKGKGKSKLEKETAMWDKINKEFPTTNWFSDKIGGADLKEFIRAAKGAPGGEYLTPDDITSTLSSIKEGELDAFLSADPTANKNLLTTELAKKIARNKKLGDSVYGKGAAGISAAQYGAGKNTALKNYQAEILGTFGGSNRGATDAGYADALRQKYFQGTTVSESKATPATKADGFSNDTVIGAAMNTLKPGEVLKAAETDNDRFMKDYNNLNKTEQAKVDNVLNSSETTTQALVAQETVKPVANITTIKEWTPKTKVADYEDPVDFYRAKASAESIKNNRGLLEDDTDDWGITKWAKELGRDAFIPGHFGRKFKDDPSVLLDRVLEATTITGGPGLIRALVSAGMKKSAAAIFTKKVIAEGRLLPRHPSSIAMPKGRIGAKYDIGMPAMKP